MFDFPKKNQFTQGTVFSCAYAENYCHLPVYGLVITARCDAAQKKVPIYSFIPVVPLRNWIFKDGSEIILRRYIADQVNTQENLLEALSLSTSLLKTKSASEIIEGALKPLQTADKRLTGKVQKFIEASKAISAAEEALSDGKASKLQPQLTKASKQLDQVIKELSGNRLIGHYFLRSMPSLYDTAPQDYVALLREIHHIPNTLAMKITEGITKEEWSHGPTDEACCPVFTNSDDFCVPIAKLRSPWMEHLMQNWTLLFARIGVEDIDFATVKKSLNELGLECA